MEREKTKYKISNRLLGVLTALSFLLCVFGIFHIPILSSFGVSYIRNRNPGYMIIILIIVIACSLPFAFSVIEIYKRKKIKKEKTGE